MHHGIPIMIDEQRSVFSVAELCAGIPTTFKSQSRLKRWAIQLLPANGVNVSAEHTYQLFAKQMHRLGENTNVLVVGGGAVGEGQRTLLRDPRITVIQSDVTICGDVALICDAHDLPFASNSLDGVVCQAVMEHVTDPYSCVEELFRVLKPGGVVYAETPFMQQVHMGRYDFTRFTERGHRRLFRAFEEIESGVTGGPGTALVWAYEYFLISFAESKLTRAALRIFARMTSFFLKYFDYYLAYKRGAYDAASGYYFVGRKSATVLSDIDLIRGYRGTQGNL